MIIMGRPVEKSELAAVIGEAVAYLTLEQG